MSRYIQHPSQHAPQADSAPSFHPSSKNNRGDERGSQSGSDDGSNYIHSPDLLKNEADPDEDPNASLTSQTLNADGTPKRPMNAFMIFARRRRPQVSAENQSMRTGEISKILSKEWNAMEPQDKQFYLDQAKQLKETFNSKYPDYVYRRRPNNSRKRRRTDGTGGRGDPPPSEPGDDLAVLGDLAEPLPLEGDDLLVESDSDGHYSRSVHDPYGDHGHFAASQSRQAAYPNYPPDMSYRQIGSHETRMQHYSSTGHERISQEAGLASPRLSQQGQSMYYPSLPQSQPHSQSSPMYSLEKDEVRGGWESRGDSGRGGPSSGWLGGNTTHDRSLGSMSGGRPHSYSPPVPQGAWSTSASPVPQPGSSTSQNYPFPTLNSPFYPNQAQQISASYSNSSSSPSPQSHNPPPQYSTTGHVRGYDQRGFSSSPSIAPASPYTTLTGRDSHLYQQQQQQQHQHQQPHRQPSISRGLPPISGYPNNGLPPSSSSQHGYWPRDKMEGQ